MGTQAGDPAREDTMTTDIKTLTTQANELRGAMRQALDDMDDAKLRKLSNELATVNRDILTGEAEAQKDARTEYMGDMHDALMAYEVEGLNLTVKFAIDSDGKQSTSIVFEPTPGVIEAITAAVAGVDRPSTATKWEYGRDEKGEHSFDFGKGTRNPSANGTGARTVGWTTPDGQSITLGDAFASCATPDQIKEMNGKGSTSAKSAYKVNTVAGAGYKKS